VKDSKQQQSNLPDRKEASAEYALYRKERYQAHILRKNTLSDQAFKTSERYDQWILTISGGALAVSVTFLEKIAPKPAPYTLWFLGFAWGGYIISLITGFFAIYYSREALYRQREIADHEYGHFVQTSTEDKPEGDQLPPEDNRHIKQVKCLTATSTFLLAAATVLLCLFALLNVIAAARKDNPEPAQATSAASTTNTTAPILPAATNTLPPTPTPQTNTAPKAQSK
jgi:hypothetical protein